MTKDEKRRVMNCFDRILRTVGSNRLTAVIKAERSIVIEIFQERDCLCGIINVDGVVGRINNLHCRIHGHDNS